LQQIRQASDQQFPKELAALLEEVEVLDRLPFPETIKEIQSLAQRYPLLWTSKIGLVYGGATKIKQYVFEAAKLPDVRGASALLDLINLVDLPAFFGGENDDRFPQCQAEPKYCQTIRHQWLEKSFSGLAQALIPELIIYSRGGNILAFCPAAFVQDLANAIEKRYTDETLTANSCAVGSTFRPLELRFGQLKDPVESTFWREQYLEQKDHPIVKAYFDQPGISDAEEKFKSRKNFSELVGKLAEQFTQRRNGNESSARPSRCYPPMYETHPYVQREEGDRRSAIFHAQSDVNDPSKGLPGDPWFSETLARKRLMGQIAKREYDEISWWEKLKRENPSVNWQYGKIESWVKQFEAFLDLNPDLKIKYLNSTTEDVKEARSLREIADVSKGFVAYIYADGNNMGGYIRQRIKTPQDYQCFSEDIFNATQRSVYIALANHLHPHRYKPDSRSSRRNKDVVWIHPFEIITIGGDDVLLVVPANQALEIAKAIGQSFEQQLSVNYRLLPKLSPKAHRYRSESAPPSECQLSMSMGVLITAQDTPIYYADQLVGQLLKSAKKRAKELKKEYEYQSGTIDFLVLKAVTMISSNISEFRSQGLTREQDDQPTLKLFAAPYTLHEVDGLLTTVKALKRAKFPRSQLYQLRTLLERGKRTAILN
jgi:CRISPR-associated protein Cmr2